MREDEGDDEDDVPSPVPLTLQQTTEHLLMHKSATVLCFNLPGRGMA